MLHFGHSGTRLRGVVEHFETKHSLHCGAYGMRQQCDTLKRQACVIRALPHSTVLHKVVICLYFIVQHWINYNAEVLRCPFGENNVGKHQQLCDDIVEGWPTRRSILPAELDQILEFGGTAALRNLGSLPRLDHILYLVPKSNFLFEI